MKKIIKSIVLCFGLGLLLQACDDWTIPENKVIQNLEGTPKSEEYYENLRAYKQTKHQIAFGWFGGWSGGSISARSSLRSIPDSMDLVSIWGDNQFNLSQKYIDDMRYVQEKYGTKVVFTIFAHEIPEPFDATPEGIKAYASAMCDSVYKYGYDGLDLDYEPGFGGTGPLVSGPGHMDNMEIFVRKLSERLGPASGTGKLLVIDGVPYHLNEGLSALFDYGIVQAYSSYGDSDLQNRFNNAYANGWKPEQYIFAENFEAHWKTGGTTNYRDKNGNVMNSLQGMARFNPEQGKKAGCGTYHMEYEYTHTPDYKYMRQAIQIMNPANPNK